MRLATLNLVRLPMLSVRILASVLRDEGIDPTEAFEAAHLEPRAVPEPAETIRGDQELAFQRAFARLTRNRPDLWIKAGLHYHLAMYGPLGQSLITASTMRQVLMSAVRDREFTYSLAYCVPLEVDGQIIGTVRDMSEVPPDIHDFTVYRDLAAMLIGWGDLWNDSFPFTRIELPVKAPADLPILRDLRDRLFFDRPRAAYYWDPAVSDRPLFHRDEVLHELFDAAIERGVGTVDPEVALMDRVMAELERSAGASLTLAHLARRMGVSQRTLQRRLSASGMTFREVASEARKRLTLRLLLNSEEPVAEIAWRVGYSEVASFNHAFRRWTGSSPARFRDENRPPYGLVPNGGHRASAWTPGAGCPARLPPGPRA